MGCFGLLGAKYLIIMYQVVENVNKQNYNPNKQAYNLTLSPQFGLEIMKKKARSTKQPCCFRAGNIVTYYPMDYVQLLDRG